MDHFRWTAENEHLAKEHLTGSLWVRKTGRFGGRTMENAPPLSHSDKKRIAGIVQVLDEFVYADLHHRRQRNRNGPRVGGGRVTHPHRLGGACQNVTLPSSTQPGGFETRYMCDSAPPPPPPSAARTALSLAPAALFYGPSAYSAASGLLSTPVPNPGLVQNWGSYVGSYLGSLFGSPAAPPPVQQPGFFASALGAVGSALGAVGSAVRSVGETALGFAQGAYSILKSGISFVWGPFSSLLTSVVTVISSAPGWAFLLPIAAAGLYMYWYRYAQRPEAAPERRAGSLLPKVLDLKGHVQGLLQLLSLPELQSNVPMQQAAQPAFGRYLEELNTIENILKAAPPQTEPANADKMLAELLTVQSNIEATKQKLVALISPQSAAIAQANSSVQQPSSYQPSATPITPSLDLSNTRYLSQQPSYQQQQQPLYPSPSYPAPFSLDLSNTRYLSQQPSPFSSLSPLAQPPPGMGFG